MSQINHCKLEVIVQRKHGGGIQKTIKHWSTSTNCEMRFSVYIPSKSHPLEKFHALIFLAGASCNEKDFLNRSNFFEHACKFRFAVVCPDTGPKITTKGCTDTRLLGKSASWYIDATRAPWSDHYQMYSYVSQELPALIEKNFPVYSKFGISGHSMGGSGACTIGLRNPSRFQSISLFAPNCNPISWGADRVFVPLLGSESKNSQWLLYDSTEVAKRYKGPFRNILIDQGADDSYFKTTKTLNPERLVAASDEYPTGVRRIKINLRIHPGKGHGYDLLENLWRSHFQHHLQQLTMARI